MRNVNKNKSWIKIIVGEGVCTLNLGDIVIGIVNKKISNKQQSGCAQYCILDESCAGLNYKVIIN